MRFGMNLIGGAALTLAAAASAHADIVFTAGPGNVAGDQNILFNGAGLAAGPASLVQGRTNMTSAVIDFLDAGENLLTPSGGQARIMAEDGALAQLTIAPHDATQAFSTFIFNLDAVANGSVTLIATPDAGLPVSQTFDLDKNGQNFFRVTTTDGSKFKSLSFVSNVGVDVVLDNRVSVVPEPTSLALLGMSGLGLVARRRRA